VQALLLFKKLQTNPEQGKATLKFFSWCFTNGAKMAEELDYIPIPSTVVKLIKDEWSREIKAQGGKSIYVVSP
jgi:phosphate transport system substrate-binding protein